MKYFFVFILLLSLIMQISPSCKTGCAVCPDFSSCDTCNPGYTYVT